MISMLEEYSKGKVLTIQTQRRQKKRKNKQRRQLNNNDEDEDDDFDPNRADDFYREDDLMDNLSIGEESDDELD